MKSTQTTATSEAAPADRQQLLARLQQAPTWDLLVIGGGATGLGVALDAAARGFSTVVLEAHDFAKGTSSRATKLAHGGVRYLAQGNISLVHEALHERTTLLRNAPHLAQPLGFVMPSYHLWETPFYGTGLKMYDVLAGRAGLGPTEFLSRMGALRKLPGLRAEGLKGGVAYWDGQFDDARLALALARTAAARGALVLNYCPVRALRHEGGRLAAVACEDAETGRQFEVRARAVVNATGVWVDEVRAMDAHAQAARHAPLVVPSQGVHIVVDQDFLPGPHALLVPKTADGRVLFAVPWLGKLLIGTTDTEREHAALEPRALPEEVAFLLRESARYLGRAPQPQDVRSCWAGLRPLVKPRHFSGAQTRSVSREHTVLVEPGGLVSVTGGKWTTYRAMAEDVLDKCMQHGLLDTRPGGVTRELALVGAMQGASAHALSEPPGLHLYGSEAPSVQALPGAEHWLAPGLSEAMVRFAARHEYARSVEDVLARRSRMLFLDARLAGGLAPAVAAILGEELGRPVPVDDFLALARGYARLPA
ncbi:glycerol-3-phosphate dehydrogenase/oxidase [Comamonas flocculans]|uniref:Glycerol-3-phosphate dehydrogenase/oxidase n=1 Tax=Comamonas flocculans TaxID=2597701 RepID=A0A5B8RUE1_9BURK|nr:glycerol-3-phosphate dehydrogenase/oxidase [Comamonas flocculans]QEA13131.1 glycerol-3-phosphate dehydrogenase/oxidase [Comamonas flocculans]